MNRLSARNRRRVRALLAAALLETLEQRRMLAFGLMTSSSTYTVDTGAGVVFSILRQGTSSTIHSGDLTSFKYNGVEYAAPYAAPGPQRYSHFESGLSNPDLTATPPFIGAQVTATVDPGGNWIKISCDDTTATVGPGATGVIQYYIARKNDPVIYMATYAPEMLVSSTRFITYLNWSKFPNHPNESDTSAIHGMAQTVLESGDVFRDPVDGHSHSKYYAENRLVDHVYHGATGPGAGAFMFIGSRESGSGGPFWKDIDFQSTGSSVELYNIPYSDHSQTEAFRPGLHGPYALVLTGGSLPAITPDYTFLDGVGLTGWVSPSGRGTLTGIASGIAAGRVPTVALSNNTAQYWCTPDPAGNYTITGIKPGTYTETLYDEELAVGTRSVTIAAGTTTTANITNTYYLPSAIFRIGTWDGTPREFLNADKITLMHPSDPRMTPWADATGATNFTVGTSPDSAWPMAEWKQQNVAAPWTDTSNRITFNLTAQQVQALTLRIGLTRAGAGGRPIISVNGGNYSNAPAASSQPGTRGVTLGSWRGNNWLYTYNISSGSLHAGTNTIDIGVASGSSNGSAWLGPWYIYDALDLVTTSSITNAPVVTSITVSPNNPTVLTNSVQTFTATARDQFNAITPANLSWSATRGTVDGAGNYIAPATAGGDTVTATSGSVNGNTSVNVIVNGSVSGKVFNDVNANGAFDGGEPTLAGATVFLDSDSDGKLDAGEATVTSGAGGDYLFSGLASGAYAVGEISPSGFVLTNEPVATVPAGGGAGIAHLPNAQIVYTGSGGSDLYTLRRNVGGNFEILLGGNLIATVFAAAPSLTFNTGSGDDTLTLDVVKGEPSPGGGVSFDGGDDADTLALVGSAANQWPLFDTSALYLNGMTVTTANLETRTFQGNGGTDQLSIIGGAVALAGPQVLASLNITAGRLDQLDHNLAVDYPEASASPIGSWNGSAYTEITGWIASGRGGGNGIVSSLAPVGSAFALGVAESAQVLGAGGGTFAGSSVDASAVLVKYTYAGDATLDGKLNIDDYTRIDQGIATAMTGWTNGDFNYDGKINIDDYVIIDANIATQGPPLGNAASVASISATAAPIWVSPPSLVWEKAEEQREQSALL